MMKSTSAEHLANWLLADIASKRALVRSTERKQRLIRCRKCWLGFVLPTTKAERVKVLRKAVLHYRSHSLPTKITK
jgi:hypothetical protein